MTQFYYQFGHTDTSVKDYKNGSATTLPEPRDFLDTQVHKNAEPIKTVEADSWIEARYSLL